MLIAITNTCKGKVLACNLRTPNNARSVDNSMSSTRIRETFFNFFNSKDHKIVPSAPIVVKDDPTLMFTNAGMNQFKDLFLGNKKSDSKRVADTQKCLRVSGKHNDLEEVGLDTYHHTMFEMLGNWSFGDYFKEEAIAWAWELLTDVYKIDKGRIYITVFEGDKEDGLDADTEAEELWKEWVAADRIMRFDKKDNFWEMGASGPCGPCSEIHVDIRSDEERAKVDGKTLVNADHPQVIEIWNLVFMEFFRSADGKLSSLPEKSVDTGMGFERLCMVLQGKQSNYDTDVFSPVIGELEKMSGKTYGASMSKADIAMRVIADHIRAVSFTIADGQLPSNNGAGYVIRRILRRAVRYGYTYLDLKEPFLHSLLATLAVQFKPVFPELISQIDLLEKVIKEEETSFLNTLESGLRRFAYIEENRKGDVLSGTDVFELYDTFGFPVDLTRLIASEKGLDIDEAGFEAELAKQKARSRADATTEQSDWVVLEEDEREEFIGYDHLHSDVRITRYRKVTAKKKELYQLVFNYTPFYAEGGGQVGDTGCIEHNGEKVYIIDTKKENNLIIHFAEKLPSNPKATFRAEVNENKRALTEGNHSATHLMHEALREVLGTHVQQKGSLVNDKYLRFDFSHFSKVTDEEIAKIEELVNQKIRANYPLQEMRDTPIDEAKEMGAMALFGEKYGDLVRVIKFGSSTELCGGTHVSATGNIGLFKIISEGAVAAGVRRIEAVTGPGALNYVNDKLAQFEAVSQLSRDTKNVVAGIESLVNENLQLKKELEKLVLAQAAQQKTELKASVNNINGINYIGKLVDLNSADAIKDLAFQLKQEVSDLFLVLAVEIDGKAQLTVMLDDSLVKDKGLNASQIIRDLAKHIQGGGGGQPFYATAGGKDPNGIPAALEAAEKIVGSL